MAPMMPIDAASGRVKPSSSASDQRQEDAELPGRAQQHQARVLQQRPEVGERADADEDQQREQLVADAHVVEHAQHAVVGDQRRQRQVGQQAAGADGQQQQRLVVLDDAQVEQHEGHADHHHRLRRDVGQALHQQARACRRRASLQPSAKRTIASPWPTAWPGGDADLGDRAGTRRADEVVHLHRVEHRDLLAALHHVAGLDVDLEDHAGHRRAQRRRCRRRGRRTARRAAAVAAAALAGAARADAAAAARRGRRPRRLQAGSDGGLAAAPRRRSA